MKNKPGQNLKIGIVYFFIVFSLISLIVTNISIFPSNTSYSVESFKIIQDKDNTSKTLTKTYYVGETIDFDVKRGNITHGGTPPDYKCESSNSKIGTTSTVCSVLFKSKGTMTLTAKYLPTNLKDSITLTVKQPVKSINFSSTSLTLFKGAKTSITTAILPVNADDKNKGLTWNNSNSNIATLTSGTISAKNTGTTTIKAIFINENTLGSAVTKTISKTLTVKVENVPVSSVEIINKSSYFVNGQTLSLRFSIKPTNAFNQNVVWNSSDPNVATIDQNGIVTALNQGLTTIKITTQEGSKTDKFVLNVVDQIINVDRVEILNIPNSIYIGKTFSLDYKIFPENATGKRIEWISLNPKIASISSSGFVTPIGAGNFKVKLRSQDDPTISQIVTIKSLLQTPKITKITSDQKDKVKIMWNKVPGAEKYTIEIGYKITENKETRKKSIKKATTNTNFVFTQISAGSINFKLLAVSNAKTSSICRKTKYILFPPQNLNISDTASTLTLGWEKTYGAKHYQIYKKVNKKFKLFKTVKRNIMVIKNPKDKHEYLFRVISKRNKDLSNFSIKKPYKYHKGFISPLDNFIVGSPYGNRCLQGDTYGCFHMGIDLVANCNEKIYSSQSGKITQSNGWGRPGNNIIIDHSKFFGYKIKTWYMHLSKRIKKNTGEQISKNTLIGKVGETGNAFGCHLHLTVIKKGDYIDPLLYFKNIKRR